MLCLKIMLLAQTLGSIAPVTQDAKLVDLFRTFFLGFNVARVKTIVSMIHDLSSARSVNLVTFAAGMVTGKLPESNYRIARGFIHEIRIDSQFLAPFLLPLFGIKGPFTLILHRTNWKFGRAKIYFLMRTVLGHG